MDNNPIAFGFKNALNSNMKTENGLKQCSKSIYFHRSKVLKIHTFPIEFDICEFYYPI